MHAVKFYEKGDRPLEIVTSRQWYIRNGGREQSLREAFLLRGKEQITETSWWAVLSDPDGNTIGLFEGSTGV